MRREMQQFAALVEAAAAGEAWAAEDAPPFPEDRVLTQRILAPSRNLLAPIALMMLGGAGLALGGWLAMLLAPALAALGIGLHFQTWSWRWCDERALRELRAVLPRFARARLEHFDGCAERMGGFTRYAASGIAMVRAPDGAPVLLMVEQGLAARIPWTLIRGWAWAAGGDSASGGSYPPRPRGPGFSVEVAGGERATWHVALDDVRLLRLWGARLAG